MPEDGRVDGSRPPRRTDPEYPPWFLNSSRSFAVPPVGSAVPRSSGFTTTRPPASAAVARGFAPSGASVGTTGVSKGFGGSKSGWGS